MSLRTLIQKITYEFENFKALYKEEDFDYLFFDNNRYTHKERESLVMLTDNISTVLNNKIIDNESVNLLDSFSISHKTI